MTTSTTTAQIQLLLLVEDNLGDADRIQDLLATAASGRYRVTHVVDLKAARSSLAENEMDVVLLDLGLPDGYGTETVRSVRQLAENVPIIVLTGHDDDELALSCISAGAQDYLCKANVGTENLTKAIKYAITRRSEAEARKAQLLKLLSALPDAVVVYNLDIEALYANDAALKLFLATPDRFIGKAIPFPVADTWLPEYIYDRDGSHRVLEIKIVPFEWETEPAFLACLRDNTEYRALTEQLRDAQKLEAIGRLAGGVAHDFNNLLTIINGYAESLLQDTSISEEHRPPLSEILDAGRRAAALTRQLLAFGRRHKSAPRVVDMNKIIDNMQNMLCRFIPEDIKIDLHLSPFPCEISGDPNELEQVIMNLCINARDAMPNGGKIHIETSHTALDRNYCTLHANEIAPGEYIVVIFSDTGTGIDKGDMKHIFEPFFTTKEMGRGTGLGLATAHGIVKQMGGYIGCYSEVEMGTTFKIYLPRITIAKLEAEAQSEAVPESLNGTETILLVEDEAGVREIIRRTLQRSGYNVLSADEGLNALRVCNDYEGEIHLLITDVVMPNMSGATLAQKLSEVRPETKTLYISGYPYNVISGRGILSGNEVLLQKPFAAKDLLTAVRKLISTAK